MIRPSGKIRQLLVDAELVDAEAWDSAASSGQPPVEDLLRRGALDEEKLFETLGRASVMAPIDVTRVHPEEHAVEAVPREVCEQNCILPIAKNGDVLTIAVTDPFDVLVLDDLAILSDLKIKPVLSHPAAIKAALATLFDDGRSQVDDLLDEVNTSGI